MIAFRAVPGLRRDKLLRAQHLANLLAVAELVLVRQQKMYLEK